MKKLVNYKKEIMAISKENGNVDIGVATNMFLNNIKDAGSADDQYHYAGAEHLDYAKLRESLPAFVEQKQEFLTDWGKELGYIK